MENLNELKSALEAAGISYKEDTRKCYLFVEGTNGVKMQFNYFSDGSVFDQGFKTAANGRTSRVSLKNALSHLK